MCAEWLARPVRLLRCSSFAKHPLTDVPLPLLALGSPCLVPVVPRLVDPRNVNLGRHVPKIKCKLCSPHVVASTEAGVGEGLACKGFICVYLNTIANGFGFL